MRTLALIAFCCCLLCACRNQKPTPLDEVTDFVRHRQEGFDSTEFELQVQARLIGAHYLQHYTYAEHDAEKWLKVLRNQKENIYARMCAAHYLADTSEEAHKFLETQLESKNLRHRYNAAEAVRLFIDRDPKKQWAIDLLLKHISAHALDGSGVNRSPDGEYPDGDRGDIMHSPLDDFCWDLGYMKCERAVPVLISVLERMPKTVGAADALGQIGDSAAIPVLMNILTNRSGYDHREVLSLGKLKAKEAVPTLISHLGNPRSEFDDEREMTWILEALLEIGDKQAIAPIRNYLATNPKNSIAATAKRVLAQFDSADPVADLLALLAAETDKYERSHLISALSRYPTDPRVLDQLSLIASKSDLAEMRRAAIRAIGEINTSKSLLFLAGLMDQTFPDDLKDEKVWKSPPPKNFTEHFHQQIHQTLKHKTGQNFPPDSIAWKQFLVTYQTTNSAAQSNSPKP